MTKVVHGAPQEEVRQAMAQREKRVKHKLICDCGAELQMTVVITWEEGDHESTQQRIEGKEFWQHMLHCVGE